MGVTNGEIDIQYRHMTIGDLALYKERGGEGGLQDPCGDGR